MTTEIYIEVMHSGNYHGAKDVAHCVNVDTGILAMPVELGIGKIGPSGDKITSYADQVDEYAIWLEDQIKAGNEEVMAILDEIFQKAQGAGVILLTACCPAPWITHAHQVKRCIKDLAGI